MTLAEEDSSVSFVSFEELLQPLHIKSKKEKRLEFGIEYDNIRKVKERKELNLSSYCTFSLSSLPVRFFNDSNMIIINNKIKLQRISHCETCVIGAPMKNGVFRISFYNNGNEFYYGVIDGYIEEIENGRSISENNVGCEMGNMATGRSAIFTLIALICCVGFNICMFGIILIGDLIKSNLFFILFCISFFILFILGNIIMMIIKYIIFYNSRTVKFYNRDHIKVWDDNNFNVGDCLTMELDLRSDKSEERTLHFFINDIQQKIFFYGLPSLVQFGVYIYFKFFSYYCLFIVIYY